jgi:hypothetical protein
LRNFHALLFREKFSFDEIDIGEEYVQNMQAIIDNTHATHKIGSN